MNVMNSPIDSIDIDMLDTANTMRDTMKEFNEFHKAYRLLFPGFNRTLERIATNLEFLDTVHQTLHKRAEARIKQEIAQSRLNAQNSELYEETFKAFTTLCRNYSDYKGFCELFGISGESVEVSTQDALNSNGLRDILKQIYAVTFTQPTNSENKESN